MGWNKKKLIIIGLLVFVLGAAIATVIYQWTRPGPTIRQKVEPSVIEPTPETPSVLTPHPQEQVAEEESGTPESPEPPEPIEPPVTMENAREVLDQRADELSPDPLFRKWIGVRDSIVRFTAAVDLVSRGESPTEIVSFLQPKEPFEPATADNDAPVVLDEQLYRRYDSFADVVHSLNTRACARVYRAFLPVLQKVYENLGYPEGDFDATFKASLIELLEAPVVPEPIFVRKKVITYVYLDPELEGRSGVQKHLIRMGPKNTVRIQEKLREIALAIGTPVELLPPPATVIQ
jgi:hypothetical protein